MADDASTNLTSPPLESTGDDILADLEETQPYRRRGVRWLLLLALLLTTGVGGALAYRSWQQELPAVAVVTTVVEPTTLENLVTAEGTVELGGQTTLKAPDDVVIETVPVAEGKRIAAGGVLVSFRNRDIEQQLDNQLIDNQIAQLDLQRQQEILQERQADLRQAQERLDESQTLLQQEFISEDAYQDDKDRVDQAYSDLRDAQVALQKAQLTIRQNQAKTDSLKAKLADDQILAPFDAMVLEVAIKAGDGVQVETDLMVIGDPSQEIITFSLSTLDAPKVRPQMPVRVGVIGPNQNRYSGRIAWIAPQAASGEQTSSQAKVDAMAVLDRPSGELIPGSAVLIEIVLNQRQEALAVPLNAIQQGENAPFVWVKDAANTAQKRPVELGISTDQAVEIVTGLEAGDEVIVSIPAEVELTPDMPVDDAGAALPEAPPQ